MRTFRVSSRWTFICILVVIISSSKSESDSKDNSKDNLKDNLEENLNDNQKDQLTDDTKPDLIYGVHLTLHFDPQNLTLVWLTKSTMAASSTSFKNALTVSYGTDNRMALSQKNIISNFLKTDAQSR